MYVLLYRFFLKYELRRINFINRIEKNFVCLLVILGFCGYKDYFY